MTKQVQQDIEESLLNGAQAMFDSDDWKRRFATDQDRVAAEELVRAKTKADAMNLASWLVAKEF